jgi:hypothetical protein
MKRQYIGSRKWRTSEDEFYRGDADDGRHNNDEHYDDQHYDDEHDQDARERTAAAGDDGDAYRNP